jgi:hypothetical protein
MINQVNASVSLQYQPESTKKAVAKTEEKADTGYDTAFSLDISVTSETRSSRALDKKEIDSLMDQADAPTRALRDVVEKLIVGQKSGNSTFRVNIEILTAGSEGTADISEDADWGVEAVSDRIVDFAKSLSGGDKSKIELLRDAIDKGFAGAKNLLGGKLPKVSLDTYDAVMQKLDDWAAESDAEASAETVE